MHDVGAVLPRGPRPIAGPRLPLPDRSARMTKLPHIATMADLRREIDRVDAALVDLLAERTAMIDRAIELKPGEGLPARIETRVEEVVEKVRARAEAAGLPPELAEALWRDMMEFFIAREERVLGKQGDGGE